MHQFWPIVRAHLGEAQRWKVMAYIAYICEPPVRNYELYRQRGGRGSVGALRQGVAALWTSSLEAARQGRADVVLARVARQRPPQRLLGLSVNLSQAASDACAAIELALQSDGTSESAVAVADITLSTIVDSLGGNLFEPVAAQPEPIRSLLEREMLRQRTCLKRLHLAHNAAQFSAVRALRREAEHTEPSVEYRLGSMK